MFTAPVGVALLFDRQVFAVVGVVVAVITGRERPANVVARRTAHFWWSVGIALIVVRVTWTVEGVVVATVHWSGSVAGVEGGNEVSADVVARASC